MMVTGSWGPWLFQCPPYAAASGSSDGTVRLWDLMTGMCTHKFKWHEEAVVQLATSLQFVISLAQDDYMCVWERSRTRLLHKISMVSEMARKSVDKESGLGEEKMEETQTWKVLPLSPKTKIHKVFLSYCCNLKQNEALSDHVELTRKGAN